MNIEGVAIHNKCGGLGIIEENGVGKVCAECMGSGMITASVEVED